MPPPLVSIIIRARNEAPALRRLIPLLTRQECDFPFEIWLLDNGSTDGSLELGRTYGLCCHHIPRDDFNYSTSLNLGAELATGEILVHLSAHCFPQTAAWLASLAAPLRHDEAVLGSYGRQWVNPSSSPFEAQGNAELFPAHGKPAIIAFSNANCAVRRSLVREHPFNPVVGILEDHLFYLELVGRGRFVYVPEAVVHHEHEHFAWGYHLRRWRREGRALYFITEHRGLPSPFRPRPFLSPRRLLADYPRIAAVLLRRRRYGAALTALPFFWLRDLTWLASFQAASRRRAQIRRDDARFLEAAGSRRPGDTAPL